MPRVRIENDEVVVERIGLGDDEAFEHWRLNELGFHPCFHLKALRRLPLVWQQALEIIVSHRPGIAYSIVHELENNLKNSNGQTWALPQTTGTEQARWSHISGVSCVIPNPRVAHPSPTVPAAHGVSGSAKQTPQITLQPQS